MLTGKTEHMTHSQFTIAFQQAAPGESWVYATGSLAYDRDKLINSPAARGELEAMANQAMQLWRMKRIELTQKSHDHQWQYIATKRKDTR